MCTDDSQVKELIKELNFLSEHHVLSCVYTMTRGSFIIIMCLICDDSNYDSPKLFFNQSIRIEVCVAVNTAYSRPRLSRMIELSCDIGQT